MKTGFLATRPILKLSDLGLHFSFKLICPNNKNNYGALESMLDIESHDQTAWVSILTWDFTIKICLKETSLMTTV